MGEQASGNTVPEALHVFDVIASAMTWVGCSWLHVMLSLLFKES